MAWTSNRRLFWTADKERVVEEGDPSAALLYRAKGQSISEAEMKRYGIKRGAGPSENKAMEPAVENKTMDQGSFGDLDEHTVGFLKDAGYDSPAAVRAASDEELRDVYGIGPKTLAAIREAIG